MKIGENLPAVNDGEPITMSSLEISDLVEARHDSVRRTIERLVERDVITVPPMVETPTPGGGKPTKVYLVGKRDSYVVVAQLSPEFTARLVDRWQELEKAQVARPLDYSDPQVMLGVMEHLNAKIAEKDEQLAIAAPKVEAYDAFLNADGLYGLQNAGRALGARPNKFIQWLKQEFLFYQGAALVARVAYIQRGYFEVITKIVDDKARPRVFITPKGLDWLRKRLPDDIRMGGA